MGNGWSRFFYTGKAVTPVTQRAVTQRTATKRIATKRIASKRTLTKRTATKRTVTRRNITSLNGVKGKINRSSVLPCTVGKDRSKYTPRRRWWRRFLRKIRFLQATIWKRGASRWRWRHVWDNPADEFWPERNSCWRIEPRIPFHIGIWISGNHSWNKHRVKMTFSSLPLPPPRCLW